MSLPTFAVRPWTILAFALSATRFFQLPDASAETVSGPQQGIWTLAESPYLVTADVHVPAGQSLVIEPGVVVQFQGFEDGMIIDGTLVARGAANAPVRFTSDDSEKEPGQWKSIGFRASSTNSVLENCVIEFGGASGWASENIWIEGAMPLLTNTTISSSRVHGLHLLNSSASVQNCSFIENGAAEGGFAVMMRADSFGKLRNNSATNNGINAIGVYGGFSRSGSWAKDQLPYTLTQDLYIPTGVGLTLEPGTIVQFQGVEDGMVIDGTLHARGTDEAQIRFTSDDSEKKPGQWKSIGFRASSTNSVMEHCVIEFGGASGWASENIWIEGAMPLLTNSVISSSRVHGLHLLNSSASVQNCSFIENGAAEGGFAVMMRADSFGNFRNNSATDNGNNAIGIYGGFPRSGSWTKDQLPYLITQDFYIPAGVVLALEPGTLIQFQGAEDGMVIDGTLHARGTDEAPIRFTSDDSDKEPGQWKSIGFRASSTNSVLENCVIEFGGASGWASENVWIEGASPLLTNSVISSSRMHGLHLLNSSAPIQNCLFIGNGAGTGGFAVFMRADSFGGLRNNSASGNGNNSIGIYGGFPRAGSWAKDQLPYTVTEDLYIPPGVSLTLEPGTIVQFQGHEDGLVIDGMLQARGTDDAPIRFTSDDSEKLPGQWKSIGFRASSTNSVMEHCVIEFGGADAWTTESVSVETSSLLMRDCVIAQSRLHGLKLLGSDSEVARCVFLNNGAQVQGHAIFMRADSLPLLSGNSARGNGNDAVAVFGVTVSRSGSWSNGRLPYLVLEELYIPAGQTLILEPGTVVQFDGPEDGFLVDGALQARGTPGAPIRFTANETVKEPGLWNSIRFRGANADSLLENAIVEYGGARAWTQGAIECLAGSPRFQDLQVRASAGDGLLAWGGSPVITRTLLAGNARDGIRTGAGGRPVISLSAFESNGEYAVRNFDSAAIVEARNNYWGDPSGPLDTENRDGLNLINAASLGGMVSEFVNWGESLNTNPETQEPENVPDIATDRTSLSFGSVAVGTSKDLTFSVIDAGSADLEVSSILVQNPRFQLIQPALPLLVPARAQREITIRFEALAGGTETGRVTINSSDPDQPAIFVELEASAQDEGSGAPWISELTPASGLPGATFKVLGTGFHTLIASNRVDFDGSFAKILSARDTEITAVIPEGLSPGTYPLTVNVGEVRSLPALFTIETAASPANVKLTAVPEGPQVRVAWPANAKTLQLETTGNLRPPVTWAPVADVPSVNGTEMVLLRSPGMAQEYFRLSGPSGGGGPSEPSAGTFAPDWQPSFPALEQAGGTATPEAGASVNLPGGATVRIPPGAVKAETPVRITKLDMSEFGGGLSRDVYQIDAGNVLLAKPAVVQFPLPAARPQDSSAEVHVFRQSDGQETVELAAQVDGASGMVEVVTDRFSLFSVERDNSYLGNWLAVGSTSGNKLLTVPFYHQGDRTMWCFAAASQMLLKFYGVDIEVWDVAKYFKLPAYEGAALWRLWAGHYRDFFESRGLAVRETVFWMFAARFNGYLIEQINQGRPVWVGVQNAAHAVIVVGYNAGGVFIHDPSGYSLQIGTQASIGEWQLAAHFLTWDQWKKAAFSTPIGWTSASPMPVWTITIEGEPGPERPVSFNLKTATVEKGLSGVSVHDNDELAILRPLPNTSITVDSRFIYEGRNETGYQFLPEAAAFGPPESAANSDHLHWTLRLHNASTSERAVTVVAMFDDRLLYRTSAPVKLPPTNSLESLVLFSRENPYRFTDVAAGPPIPGKHLISAHLIEGSVTNDSVSIDLVIAPARPTGLKKEKVPQGVKLTWNPNPEHDLVPLLYNIYKNGELIGATSRLEYLVEGGEHGAYYTISADAFEQRLEGPRSSPAEGEGAGGVFVRQAPKFPRTRLTTVGMNDNSLEVAIDEMKMAVSWTEPPATLEPGQEFEMILVPAAYDAPSSASGRDFVPLSISIYAPAVTEASLVGINLNRLDRARAGYENLYHDGCTYSRPCYVLDTTPPLTTRLKASESNFILTLQYSAFALVPDGRRALMTGSVSWEYVLE